jgi:hypothetical protein
MNMNADEFIPIAEKLSCPICTTLTAKLRPVGPLAQKIEVDCPTCGEFTLTDLAHTTIRGKITQRSYLSAVLGYYIRRMQGRDKNRPMIDEKLADDFLKRELPGAAEQADNLILWIGGRTQIGDILMIDVAQEYPMVGANFGPGMMYILRELKRAKLLEELSGEPAGRLTFEGWAKYQDLKKGKASGRKAFMAMPFGDTRLAQVYAAFQAAVTASGFTLEKLDERPIAGLIDNRLRVEIQTSRFVVVDLTNDNNGAYWEGGFAEGLGKPVFYSCEKSYFDKKPTHFDANHLYTVLWDFEKLDTAAAELKNAIRATLPDEAKLTDD